ncbi:MAG TPA: hypothetical protein VF179_20415 [Thermoanaerobaculia bacterium]|nr:hypothetical protein [Thermoanaerobaculia bacterium]
MPQKPYQALRSPLAWSLGIIVLANLLFFALLVAAQGNQEVIIARVRAAFETGELGLADYLFFDSRRGWHQYNDCNVLQMLVNRDSSRLKRALAPKVFYRNKDRDDQCAVLRAVVVEGVDPNTLLLDQYARHWHGYKVVAAIGLSVMELRDLRRVLSGAVWFAIAVLALVTCRSGPRTRRTGLIIALAAATVWAVPYFAPGFTHGPGDALLLLALTAIAAWPGMAVGLRTIGPYAAGFGATVVFFEMLTAQLPIAIAWLAAMVLAAGRDEKRPGDVAAPIVTLAAVTAFGLAAAATVITKQIIAVLIAEPQAGVVFLSHLSIKMGVPESQGNWPGMLRPFARLVQWSRMLTFGNTFAGYGLVAAAGLAWLAAAIRGWYKRDSEYGRDVLILVSAALVPVAWVFLLPSHTDIHAGFMVRMLIVPISLAPLALCWPSAQGSR